MVLFWEQLLYIHGSKYDLQYLLSFTLTLLSFNLTFNEFNKILLNTLRHQCWKTSWKRKKLNSSKLASGLATHCEQNQQQISIHEYISSGHYCADTDLLIPVSSLLSLSDADEKCSMFRSPQHYHSVFSTCYQMTPKCWLRMINVVLVNT